MTPRHVLNMCDVSNIWHVPIMMEAQGAHKSICDILGLGGYNNMNLTGQPLEQGPDSAVPWGRRKHTFGLS